MAQQAYDYLAQSPRPQMPRRRRSSASTGDRLQQQLSTLSLLSPPPQSQSGSSSDESTPPSLIFSSGSVSPASSLTSSPSLGPKSFSHSAAGPEPLSLEIPLQPNSVDLAKYASDIIRNEAYALLALAARLAPAAYPLLDDEGAHVVRTDSSSSVGTEPSDDGSSEEAEELYAKSPVDPAIMVEESRTNHAFRNVVTLVQSMPRHGKILISGIGKSGIVAKKMVATFCSLGIQAAFLHPVEALHGDLGLVCSCSPASPCDTVFLISHSGATAELMRLLPIVRPRVRSLVAITRDPESVLASSCHGWLDAGTGVNPAGLPKATTDEADSALPAPTSSVVSALAIGDALALTLSRLRTGWDADTKRRREEFYHCHPGGQLGIQLGREGRAVDGSAAGKIQPSVPVPPILPTARTA
ncbi:SIS domain-containing protein [Rhodotorula sp. JG-1b]|nr:SIS domain-containing protein [Rhodotorula sp. JG-1b]